MKKLIIIILAIAILIGAAFISYNKGLHNQCTEIKLYNNFSFTCDGREIQGTIADENYVTHTWEYSSF